MSVYSASIYLAKVNCGNTSIMCKICSKLTLKAPKQSHSGVFIVNFQNISHIVLVFPLFTLNKQVPTGYKLTNFSDKYLCISISVVV